MIYTKLLRQKPMLRQMEWGVQNGPLTKNGVLPSNYFVVFKNFVSVQEPLIESWFDVLLHSMLAAYGILVPTLYRNCGTRLHGFRQHCLAGWKFYFFRLCPTKSLTGCWVECRATLSALVSAHFHSKEGITLYFFWMWRTWYIHV